MEQEQNLQHGGWFQDAFETAAIGMALVSPEGGWLKVNQSLLDIVGYTEEELLSKTFQDITHPDDLKTDLSYVKEMLDRKRKSYVMKKRYFHKDGSIVWIRLSVSLVWNEDGTPRFFVSQIEDISKEVEHEEEQNVKRQREEQILNAVVGGLYIYDAKEQKNEYINAQYTSITGWTLEDINGMGEKFLELFHPEDLKTVLSHMEEILASKEDKTYMVEYRFKTKSGDWIWCLSMDTPYERAADGSVAKFIGSFLDITEKVGVEEKLKEQIEQLDALNKMMTGRELKMTELKSEVNGLLAELGREPRYS